MLFTAGLVLAAATVVFPAAAFASSTSRGNGNAASHAKGNAGTSGTYNQPQPYSTADQNNTGANDTSASNQYRSTAGALLVRAARRRM